MVRCEYALLIDPDTRFRAALARRLRHLDMATQEGAGSDALGGLPAHPPRIAVVEVDLADISGYEICRELRDRYGPELPIVFVSARRSEPADRVAGLLIGADDYLGKPVDLEELVVRVRKLIERARRAPVARHPELTPRELEVLRMLAQGATQTQIAGELGISPKTVSSHLERVLVKTGVHSRAQAVSWAFRKGLVAQVA